jgi:hypothetical protein
MSLTDEEYAAASAGTTLAANLPEQANVDGPPTILHQSTGSNHNEASQSLNKPIVQVQEPLHEVSSSSTALVEVVKGMDSRMQSVKSDFNEMLSSFEK